MNIIIGLECTLPDQKTNSAPSTESPLNIYGTLKSLVSQAPNLYGLKILSISKGQGGKYV